MCVFKLFRTQTKNNIILFYFIFKYGWSFVSVFSHVNSTVKKNIIKKQQNKKKLEYKKFKILKISHFCRFLFVIIMKMKGQKKNIGIWSINFFVKKKSSCPLSWVGIRTKTRIILWVVLAVHFCVQQDTQPPHVRVLQGFTTLWVVKPVFPYSIEIV